MRLKEDAVIISLRKKLLHYRIKNNLELKKVDLKAEGMFDFLYIKKTDFGVFLFLSCILRKSITNYVFSHIMVLFMGSRYGQ